MNEQSTIIVSIRIPNTPDVGAYVQHLTMAALGIPGAEIHTRQRNPQPQVAIGDVTGESSGESDSPFRGTNNVNVPS